MPALILPHLSDVKCLLVSTSNLCLSYIRPEGKSASPITRIPPEILREIFLFALLSPSHPEITPVALFTPVISDGTRISPFPLSNVNRNWRYIINSTPAIWRSIAVIGPHPDQLYRMELWLERAKNYSLDITIMQRDDPDEEECDATLKVLGLLIVRIARWRSIDLHLPAGIPPSIVAALEDIQRLPRPALQDARIASGFLVGAHDVDEWATNNKVDSLYKALQRTLTLRKLTWQAPLIPHTRFGAHLMFLELYSPIYVRELAYNVVRCPNLTFLSARNVLGSTSIDGCKAPITLANLVVIILTMTDHPPTDQVLSLVPFLQCFSAPSLTTLQLQNVIDHADEADVGATDVATLQLQNIMDHADGEADAGDADVSPQMRTRMAVQELLQRSKCHLKSFNVHIRDASSLEVRAWMNIEGVENVEILGISGGVIDNEVLEVLTWQYGETSKHGNSLVGKRFPNLSQLGLSLCDLSVDEGVLLRMLGSRFWTAVMPCRPRKTRKELLAAHIWVQDLTPNMEMYEKMINRCAKNMNEWRQGGRELRFTLR